MTAPMNWPEDFWRRVALSPECWEWTGSRDPAGYGLFQVMSQSRRAARVAWLLANPGRVLSSAEIVRHRCDNPPCVRPSHLLIGSHADNAADRVSRGRGAIGVLSGQARLSESQVTEIRSRRASGELLRELGADFGIGTSQVSRICLHQRWRHLPAPLHKDV